MLHEARSLLHGRNLLLLLLLLGVAKDLLAVSGHGSLLLRVTAAVEARGQQLLLLLPVVLLLLLHQGQLKDGWIVLLLDGHHWVLERGCLLLGRE